MLHVKHGVCWHLNTTPKQFRTALYFLLDCVHAELIGSWHWGGGFREPYVRFIEDVSKACKVILDVLIKKTKTITALDLPLPLEQQPFCSYNHY